MPPYLETTLYQITVTIDRGQSIKKMDTWGTVDPYIIVKFGAITMKTPYKSNTQNPTWQSVIKVSELFLCSISDFRIIDSAYAPNSE